MANALRVDRTPYDNFLDVLLSLTAGLSPNNRAIMSRVYDQWNTFNGYQLLNAVFSKDRTDPQDGAHSRPFQRIAGDASDVIAWKVEGGPRPSWLSSITDSDLAAL